MNFFTSFLLSFLFLLPLGLSFDPSAHANKKNTGLIQVIQKAVTDKVKPLFVDPPKDQEVCFSPEEPCDLKLVKFIESAQKSIDVAIFDINLDQVVHQLLVKSKMKNVKVRVLVDKRQAKGNHSLVPTLQKGGVDLKYGSQRGIMHNKFVIIDGKAVEIGSFNYTNHAAKANNENQVYLWSQPIVDRYQTRFEEIWNKGKPVT